MSMDQLHLAHSHSESETHPAKHSLYQSDRCLAHSHSEASTRHALLTRALPPKDVVFLQEPMFASTSSLNWSGRQALAGRSGKGSHGSLNKLTGEPETVPENTIIAVKGRITLPVIISAAACVFGGSVPHGWNTGVLNSPMHLIQGFLNETFEQRFGYPADERVLNLLWAMSVSMYLVGGCAGAFSFGWMANKFGRKRALIYNTVFGFAGAILFALCETAQSFEMLIIGRIIVGFGCGAGSGLVPMYLTEISPVNYRGAMGVLHQFGLTLGILLSQIVGMRQLLGHPDRWPYLLAFTGVWCLSTLFVLPFFPDSPRFLYVVKNDQPAAEKALRTFRGKQDVYWDIEEMKDEQQMMEREPKWTFKKLLSAKELRMPLLLLCALATVQQLSGINVVFYYSGSVFEAANIPDDKIQYANVATGLINVIMTAISVPLVEVTGRRPLLLGGMATMVVAAAAITVTINLQYLAFWLSYVSILCIVCFVIGFAIGLGSIPQFIGGELFLQGPRPPAMSLSGFLNWLCNFLIGIIFPFMNLLMGAYSFLVFIGIVTSFGVFLFWKLPETKNKTHAEIQDELNKHRTVQSTVTGADVEMSAKPVNGTNGHPESVSLLKTDEPEKRPL